ncbi:ATP-binding protein [Streptomyces sp. NPDC046860]|uniref:ATP-binding protein n=1 Tax=Streptomyces sp. NPDC046860 TaxID=3154495 RepID=UPI0033CB1A47
MSDRASPTRPVTRHRAAPTKREAPCSGLRRRIRLIVVLPVAVTLFLTVGAYWFITTSGLSDRAWPVWAAVVITGSVVSACVAGRLGTAAVVEAKQERAALDQQVEQSVAQLRSVLPDALREVDATVRRVRKGEAPGVRQAETARTCGPFAQLELDLGQFVADVQRRVADSSVSSEQAALLTISRRMQSLVGQVLTGFDRLEESIEDAEILPEVFKLDHGVTRIRRLADSFALIGGALPRRSATPLLLAAVIQHAISQVDHYTRVQQVTVVNDLVVGEVTVRLVHLLAELIENATMFSSPDTPVMVRAERVPAGVIIEIDDRGKLMPAATMQHLNRLLAADSRQLGGEFARDGRIGMRVVAEHAQRLGVQVQFRPNIYGANQAVVLIPHRLFVADEEPAQAQASGQPGVSRFPESADPDLTSATLQMAAVPPRPVAGRTPTPDQVPAPSMPLPRRPTERTSARREVTPAVPAPSAGHTSSAPPLPSRDLSQSYLAPELRDRPQAPAPDRKTADPFAFAQFKAGQEKAAGATQHTD